MNAKLQLRTLVIVAALLLLSIGGLSAWLGQDVLNPIRNVTLTATGSSILAEPRAFFKTPAIAGTVGQPVNIRVYIDSNGGNLASISAELRYNPLDMEVTLDTSQSSICRAYTKQQQDPVAGRYIVTCTAPTTNGGQVSPFLNFTAVPRRTGGLPIQLIGRQNDYGVITAQ